MQEDQKIDYLEFPGDDFDALQAFYEKSFEWKFIDYGPEYRAFSDGKLDGGFYKSPLKARRDDGSVLVVLYSTDLDASLEKVKAAGGVIVQDIFSFPGGRRFHFADPHGNELAVWSDR